MAPTERTSFSPFQYSGAGANQTPWWITRILWGSTSSSRLDLTRREARNGDDAIGILRGMARLRGESGTKLGRAEFVGHHEEIVKGRDLQGPSLSGETLVQSMKQLAGSGAGIEQRESPDIGAQGLGERAEKTMGPVSRTESGFGMGEGDAVEQFVEDTATPVGSRRACRWRRRRSAQLKSERLQRRLRSSPPVGPRCRASAGNRRVRRRQNARRSQIRCGRWRGSPAHPLD